MKKLLLKMICISLSTFCFLCNTEVSANEHNNHETTDGFILLDYENAKQQVDEDGNIEGTIPLKIYEYDDNGNARNITMPDGSQYRYSYLSGSHSWFYEFVITGGFKSYSGSIVLTKLQGTNPNTVYVTCSGKSKTVSLPLNTKRSGYSLYQTGIVRGINCKKYTIPRLYIIV